MAKLFKPHYNVPMNNRIRHRAEWDNCPSRILVLSPRWVLPDHRCKPAFGNWAFPLKNFHLNYKILRKIYLNVLTNF